MPISQVIVCSDREELARSAVARIVQAAEAAILHRGRFTLVLAGGSTPQHTYEQLSRATIDWSSTCVFFGDERFVPHDDPRSNYFMARRALLDAVPIASDHVFPIQTTFATPSLSADDYADALARFFGNTSTGNPPRFDLILLGLGEDGHTASLFPGSNALSVTDKWVISGPPGVLPPPVERITLTYPVLNAARNVLFLVAGSEKAAVVRDVLDGNASRDQRPAVGVVLTDGTVTWLIDKSASRGA